MSNAIGDEHEQALSEPPPKTTRLRIRMMLQIMERYAPAVLADAIKKEDNALAGPTYAKIGDDTRFWWRRFLTVLGIANTGALVALTTGVFQASDPVVLAKLTAGAMSWFAVGMVASGALPLFMGFYISGLRAFVSPTVLEYPRYLLTYFVVLLVSAVLAIGSFVLATAAFIVGVMTLVGVVNGLAAN